MGLQSTLNTSLTGLQAAETTIDVVGNNVANSSTVGFKQSQVNFATQFLQTQSIGAGPTSGSGGANPRQIGLGVRVAEISPDFTQGTIEISSNPLDVAIQGDGFLIVQGNGTAQQYTRNGQLKTNANNEIVTVTGNRVLGFGVNDEFEIQRGVLQPMEIPFGASAVAQQTSNVTLNGNLRPQATIGNEPGIIDSAILSDKSFQVPGDFANSDVGQIGPPTVDSITVTANAAASGTVDAGTYNYKIVFVDESASTSNPSVVTSGDESAPSLSFGGNVASDGTQSIDLTSLPTTSNSTLTHKRIYRTDAAGDFKLVATIPAGDTTYTDNTTNASLGVELNDKSLDTVNYSYFVSYYNSSSGFESRPTSQSNNIAISSDNRRIQLDNLPTDASSADFDSVRIYRNVEGQPNTFFKVATLDLVDLQNQKALTGRASFIDNKPDSEIISTVPADILDRNGPSISTATSLTNLSTFDGSRYVDLFEAGTLSFTGSKGFGTVSTKEFEIIENTTTVQDYIDFLEESLGIQTSTTDALNPLTGNPGGSVTGDSRIRIESNQGLENEVGIGLSAFQLSVNGGSPNSIPLAFNEVQASNGEGTAAEFIAYDSLGIPTTIQVRTVRESAEDNGVETQYRWFATSADNQPASGVSTIIGTGVLTFGPQGQFISASNDTVSVDRRDVASASPVEFQLDFSSITSVAPIDDSTSTLEIVQQDGFGAGSLTSFQVSETGRIIGIYSNGITRDIGQLQLARFTNAEGLIQIGDNLFAAGVNSGEPQQGDPGSNGLGGLTSGAVELSNTDIGENLIELILASTQYRGNARVISTTQELLDELLALSR